MTSLLIPFSGILQTGYEIGLNWLGVAVRAIIEGIGIIGVGIIVFTLILKAITLPFDIYQRVKMRKQTLIMREMQPELEKLQKQYANDKSMYQQKMMELYKKNGYSMLGACLPMIISLVILIVAFSAFRAYSNYANLNMYVKMSEQYNSAILANCADGVDYSLKKDEEGNLVVGENGDYILYWIDENGEEQTRSLTWETGSALPGTEDSGISYIMIEKEMNGEMKKYLSVSQEGKYLSYYYNLETTKIKPEYELDTELLLKDEAAAEAIAALEAGNPEEEIAGMEHDSACKQYVVNIGANAVAEWYRDKDANNSAKFLWIKNVWYPDVSYQHPIQDYDTFQKSFQNAKIEIDGKKTDEGITSYLDKDSYNYLTSALDAEKTQANGYFILVVLSIGFMLLSQFITMKSSKESNKYQTVDGQGARTQKMMLIMMPLMYAVFAFMNSAAFSIYMTVSSVVAILVTLLSNLFIGLAFKKKEEEQLKAKHTRTVPWKETGDKKNKKEKKNKKK